MSDTPTNDDDARALIRKAIEPGGDVAVENIVQLIQISMGSERRLAVAFMRNAIKTIESSQKSIREGLPFMRSWVSRLADMVQRGDHIKASAGGGV